MGYLVILAIYSVGLKMKAASAILSPSHRIQVWTGLLSVTPVALEVADQIYHKLVYTFPSSRCMVAVVQSLY